jgi:hypothetical protein
MDSDTKIECAEKFSNSKVKKRFLTQMIPLKSLLTVHGLGAFFALPTIFCITNRTNKIVVALEEGECRFGDNDLIFCIFDLDEIHQPGYHVRANSMKGVIRTLVRWNVIGENEITDDEIDVTAELGHTHCACCGRRQTFMQSCRYKQCKICHDRDKREDFPGFNGFYCSKDCQKRNWATHKKQFHC